MNETPQSPQPVQPQPTPCPICGGARVFTTTNSYMTLMVGPIRGTRLNAIACTECGYTQLFAEEPRKLKRLLR